MEHRLILGGEKWLPFARSRIKALRATGMTYASQKYEIEGVSIHVRVSGNDDYIELRGGNSLPMDSGVVEVSNIAPESPDRYLPGELYETDGVAEYQAPFIYDETDPPGRTNPGTGSAGQLAGTISRSSRFRGRIPDEPASFAPGLVDADPPTSPPTRVPDPSDDLLHLKKQVGILCPASIFTGKTRLYVQSMYGLPLYEYGMSGRLIRTNTPPDLIQSNVAPALLVPSYVRSRDTTAWPAIVVNTSCGIWLDTSTGKHWLIQPMNGVVTIYPLISTPAGEALRRYLKSGSSLNSTDSEHLEAYILAYCLPDVRHSQTANGGYTCGDYSMGYGWHWNWDGTDAELVKNEMFLQDEGEINRAMRSTHYRMSLIKVAVEPPIGGFGPDDAQQTWESPVAVISGPSDWMVPRGSWCITEPSHGAGVLEKTTPRYSTRFTGAATFYAFYKKNELQLCTVNVTFIPAETPHREMSERFAASLTYQSLDITYTTLGENDGYLVDEFGWAATYAAQFSCAGVTTPILREGHANSGAQYLLNNKVFLGYIFFSSDTFFGSQSFQYGYPPWESVTYTRNSVTTNNAMYSYDIVTTTYSESRGGGAQIVVPFNDAEAVYLRWSTSHTRTDTGTKKQWLANIGGFKYREQKIVNVYVPPLSSVDVELLKYDWQTGGGVSGANSGATTAVDTTINTDADDAKFIGKAGTLPATFTHLSEFGNAAEDFVGATFGTISTESAVIAPGYVDATGVTTPPAAPVFVGWA